MTQPSTEYGSSGWNTPLVTARPGHSVSIIGALQVCADHATLGEQALGVVAEIQATI